MAYTLSFDLAPDASNDGNNTVSTVSIYVSGTEHTLGAVTSPSASVSGAYVWATYTFDVTSYFPADVMVRMRCTGGADTNHIRRVFITDGTNTWYDQYGLLWWNSPAPPYFTNNGWGSDPQSVGPVAGPVPTAYNDLGGYAITATPGNVNGAFAYINGVPPEPEPERWVTGFAWSES